MTEQAHSHQPLRDLKGRAREDRARELFDAHNTKLVRHASRFGGSDNRSEDAAQDAWLAFFAHPPQNESNISGYLHRATETKVLDQWRRESRRPKEAFSSGEAETAIFTAPASENTEDEVLNPTWEILETLERMDFDGRRTVIEAFINDIESPELQESFRTMSPDFLDVLMLVEVGGLSYKDAAAVIGKPIGTVMSRLHRAKKHTKQYLIEESSGSEDGNSED